MSVGVKQLTNVFCVKVYKICFLLLKSNHIIVIIVIGAKLASIIFVYDCYNINKAL